MKQTEFRNHPKMGTFEDETYIVEVKAHPYGARQHDDVYWVDVSRHDKKPICSWADLQRIKNKLIGREHEAFMVYPPESRLVDEGNHYHLFVFRKPNQSLGFGFKYRKVKDEAQ